MNRHMKEIEDQSSITSVPTSALPAASAPVQDPEPPTIQDGSDCHTTGHFSCEECGLSFVNRFYLRHHLKSFHPHICTVCGATFSYASDLAQHEASLAHVLRTMPCAIKSCECSFKSTSGLAHHMENGKHMDRHAVTRAVRKMDQNHIISVKRVENPSSTDGAEPSSNQPHPQSQMQAPNPNPSASGTNDTAVINGNTNTTRAKPYPCIIPGCRRTFKDIFKRSAHLNSAAHDANEFKCPRCSKEFKIVSALIQHVEASLCIPARGLGSGSGSADAEGQSVEDIVKGFTRRLTIGS